MSGYVPIDLLAFIVIAIIILLVYGRSMIKGWGQGAENLKKKNKDDSNT